MSAGEGEVVPVPAGAASDRTRLILTIQKQTDTLDKLHAALKQYKDKVLELTGVNTVLMEENSKLQGVQVENAAFRAELETLQGKMDAFQRKQEGLGARESEQLAQLADAHRVEVASLRDHSSALAEENRSLREMLKDKDARITLLVAKRNGQQEAHSSEIKQQLHQMRDAMSSLQMQLQGRAEQCRTLAAHTEQLKHSLESANEDLSARDATIAALETENRAIKKNLTQLIQQKHGRASVQRSTSQVPPPYVS
eukprot:TRINITY_DN20917_c0_g1_i1.p1 TRINITY_DN20917_c0_g1~~TRINITY_DN20917_c0_g1_i1.p1  ORF type:complete len:254 (+),score=122.06 TRINITY_DN20917_c0_g1_i1:69-830(+)